MTDDPVHSSPEAALEEFVRSGWQNEIHRRLVARYGRACGSAAVDEAIGHALEKAAGQLEARRGRQVYVFVMTAAEHWLFDTFKGARRARARGWTMRIEPTDLDALHDPVETGSEDAWVERDADAVKEDIAAALLHRLETGEQLETLSERVRVVMTLFHVENLTKRQIRERTGLTPKQLRNALVDGNRFLHDEYLAIESNMNHGDCGDAARAVTRLVFDLARGREAQRARAHVRHCLICARRAQHADSARQAFALVLPASPLAVSDAGGLRGSMLDPLVALGSRARSVLARIAGDATETAQAAAAGGVGRGAASPVAAGIAKLAALCLASGGIAATCIGTGVFGSAPPNVDHATTSRSTSQSQTTTTASLAAARSIGTPKPIVHRVTRARLGSSATKRRSTRRSTTTADEFFTPAAQPASTPTRSAPATTPASSRPQSTSSEPGEFPIF